MTDETPATLSPEMMAMMKAAAEAATTSTFIGAAIVGAMAERDVMVPHGRWFMAPSATSSKVRQIES